MCRSVRGANGVVSERGTRRDRVVKDDITRNTQPVYKARAGGLSLSETASVKYTCTVFLHLIVCLCVCVCMCVYVCVCARARARMCVCVCG